MDRAWPVLLSVRRIAAWVAAGTYIYGSMIGPWFIFRTAGDLLPVDGLTFAELYDHSRIANTVFVLGALTVAGLVSTRRPQWWTGLAAMGFALMTGFLAGARGPTWIDELVDPDLMVWTDFGAGAMSVAVSVVLFLSAGVLAIVDFVRLRHEPPDSDSESGGWMDRAQSPPTETESWMTRAAHDTFNPDGPENDAPPKAEGASTKECPFCAETIKAKAVVCRYCKRDLPSET